MLARREEEARGGLTDTACRVLIAHVILLTTLSILLRLSRASRADHASPLARTVNANAISDLQVRICRLRYGDGNTAP
jgi:hypothetical protein